jgi:hypothetical protein
MRDEANSDSGRASIPFCEPARKLPPRWISYGSVRSYSGFLDRQRVPSLRPLRLSRLAAVHGPMRYAMFHSAREGQGSDA